VFEQFANVLGFAIGFHEIGPVDPLDANLSGLYSGQFSSRSIPALQACLGLLRWFRKKWRINGHFVRMGREVS